MGQGERRRGWGSRIRLTLVVLVCIPLVPPLLLAYGLYALLLHVLLWIVWGLAGKRVLFVYSNSPVWQSYIEGEILPRLPHGSVVLNWSERRSWRRWSLAAAVFHCFGGRREFNPLAIVVRPLRWVRVFRFWRAFRDAKHGNRHALHQMETQFFSFLGLPDHDAAS